MKTFAKCMIGAVVYFLIAGATGTYLYDRYGQYYYSSAHPGPPVVISVFWPVYWTMHAGYLITDAWLDRGEKTDG